MKVNDPRIAGGGVEPGKTHGARAAHQDSTARPGAGRAGGSSDRVEVSPVAGKISRAIHASDTAQAARVERLAAEYRAGTYKVDAHAVGRAMVAETLAAGAPPSGAARRA